MKKLDLTNARFGRLLVTERAPDDGRRSRWHCRCDCGREVIALTERLRSGNTKSCGCFRVDNSIALRLIHGHNHRGRRSREYGIWSKMKGRCLVSTDRAYPKYGGRGITVCDRWLKFENFVADMGPCPDGLTIERMDNDKGYEPDNCKWGTREEQAQNRRSSRLNPDLVREILLSQEEPKQLAAKINISAGLISQVRRRKIWKNITLPSSPTT